MSKYLIALKPTGRFFFGGDMTFAQPQVNVQSKNARNKSKSPSKSNHNDRFASYIIESNYMPQQTSLLGMLRFQLLSNSEYFDKTKQCIINIKENLIPINNLIGSRSFVVTKERTANDFGAIKSLSNCMIQIRVGDSSTWHNLYPSEPQFTKTIDFANASTATLNGNKIQLPFVPEYSAKDGFDTIYQFGSNSQIVELDDDLNYVTRGNVEQLCPVKVKFSDIFVSDVRVGISKKYDGSSDESAFFKQKSFRFNDKLYTYDSNGNRCENIQKCEYRFAFYANICDIGIDINSLNGSLVSLGADSSTFIMKVESNPPREELLYECNDNKIILQSPAMIDPDIVKTASFAIAHRIPFRFMVPRSNTYKHSPIVKRSDKKYYLFAAGSIFYFADNVDAMDKFAESLKANICFSQIGYNKFIKIIKQ